MANYVSPVHTLLIHNNCYTNCQTIQSIDLHKIDWVNNSMGQAFEDCKNIKTILNISTSVTNMGYCFRNCTALVDAPTIPSSVLDFGGTFFGCIALVNAPIIPSSVTRMVQSFQGCTKMSTAPTIPASVTNVVSMFQGCTNLTGNITINSNKITDAANCFNGTSKTKNVFIPFVYSNGVNSATYNAFTTAGYKIDGSRNGVFLKDSTGNYFTLTVNPTPSDATVTLT